MPITSEFIRINSDLTVKLYCRDCPVPLPQWFRNTGCKLKSATQLENFPSYIRGKSEEHSSPLAAELENIRYMHHPTYSTSVIRFALMLRYTSLQAYNLLAEEYKLPSTSYLSKLKSAGIDAVKALKVVKDKNLISEDVVMMFDEMYIQQYEEYSAGKFGESNADGEFYTGVLAFMIVGLKSSVSFVVRAIPKTKLTAEFIQKEMEKTLSVIMDAGFNVSLLIIVDQSIGKLFSQN